MIDNTKISILFCLTVIVTGILIMSYNEYVNRFSIITTQNNVIYIFDKKSATLNKCENDQCTLIQTNFPQNPIMQNNNKNQATQQYATNVTPLPNIMPNQQQQNNITPNNNINIPLITNNTPNFNPLSISSTNPQQNIPQVTVVNGNS